MPKQVFPHKMRSLNMKTTPETRAQLEAAALASGRTLTAEVEARIARSFLLDEMRQMIREEMGRAPSQPTPWVDFGKIICGSPVPGVYRPDQAA